MLHDASALVDVSTFDLSAVRKLTWAAEAMNLF